MLHHYYYVNGKRVSEDQYIAANARNEYEKFAFQKAKEYYKTHEFEWYQLCQKTSEENLARAMIYHFESKVKRTERFWYVVVGIIIIVWIIAGISICSGHSS